MLEEINQQMNALIKCSYQAWGDTDRLPGYIVGMSNVAWWYSTCCTALLAKLGLLAARLVYSSDLVSLAVRLRCSNIKH